MVVSRASEAGSAIFFLFLAIAAFGALSYTLLQGSRGSTTMITGEAAKAKTYQSQDCANALNMATKRLQMRGCESEQISSDETGAVGTGPTDGTCAIYHPNGGAVKGACAPPSAPASDICTTGPIGTVCTADNAFYIGDVGGNRIYAAASDQGSTMQWKTSTTATGTTSTTNGLANTAAMVAADAAAHPAANGCATKAPLGAWYLPAKDELYLVWSNRMAIDLVAKGFNTSNRYWSSSEISNNNAWVQRLSDGNQTNASKPSAYLIRCVRR